VHVYRNGKEVAQWDLENERLMKGNVSQDLLGIIRELQEEGRL